MAVAAVATMLATTSPALAATSNDQTQFSVTAGSLAFTATVPDVPNLPGLTLNGQAQTLNGTMNNFGVDDATGSAAGWNVTVSGDNSGGKSAVFKRYCPNATCGADSGPAYVAGGATLAANTITLNSTSASFTGLNGTTGTAPTHQCNAGCFVDAPAASPVKIVSAASGAGMGTWGSTGWTGTSVAASAPSTVQGLPANEVYRVDLLWTLGSGP